MGWSSGADKGKLHSRKVYLYTRVMPRMCPCCWSWKSGPMYSICLAGTGRTLDVDGLANVSSTRWISPPPPPVLSHARKCVADRRGFIKPKI